MINTITKRQEHSHLEIAKANRAKWLDQAETIDWYRDWYWKDYENSINKREQFLIPIYNHTYL